MKIKIALVIILILAAVLRFWGAGDFSLGIDEAISSNAAISIIEEGQPYYYPGSENIYDRDPIHTYSMALSFKIFGVNEFAARLPFILCGILAVFGTYLLSVIITKNKIVSLVAAAAMAFSFWAVGWSHNARMYEMLRMFTVFDFIFFYLFFVAKKRKEELIYLLLSLSFLLLAYFSHRSAIILFIVLGLLVFIKYQEVLKKYYNLLIFFSFSGLVACGIFLAGYGVIPFINIQPADFKMLTQLSFTAIPWNFLLVTYPLWFLGFWFFPFSGKISKNQKVFFWITLTAFVIIDLLIYGNTPSYRSRYFQLLVPLFFIFGTHGLYIFYKKHNYKKVIVLFLALFLIGLSGFTVYTPDTYKGTSEIKEIRQSIELQEDDLVIAHPVSPAYYYFGKVDYWLATNDGEIHRYSEDGIDHYGGALVLDNLKDLEEIVNQGQGYIIIEENRFRFINEEIEKWLYDNLELLSSSTEEIKAWKF